MENNIELKLEEKIKAARPEASFSPAAKAELLNKLKSIHTTPSTPWYVAPVAAVGALAIIVAATAIYNTPEKAIETATEQIVLPTETPTQTTELLPTSTPTPTSTKKPSSGISQTGISGNIYIGPVCREEKNPYCLTKPSAATVVIKNTNDATFQKNVKSDDFGKFYSVLESGSYELYITDVAENPRCVPVFVDLKLHQVVSVDIYCLTE